LNSGSYFFVRANARVMASEYSNSCPMKEREVLGKDWGSID